MESTKKSTAKKATTPSGVVAPKAVKQTDVVKVRNKTSGIINTTKGPIEAGKEGQATVAEARQLSKYLEKI